MRWTVTCDDCGHVIESGFGLRARWEQPHHVCPSHRQTVVWTYDERLTKLLSRLSQPAAEREPREKGKP